METNSFYIEVAVKPYVKQFLINNGGDPVVLDNGGHFKTVLYHLLKKPKSNATPVIHKPGVCTVRILIAEDTFYRYGCFLSATGEMQFAKLIEQHLKFIMRTRIFVMTRWLGITESIREFQDKWDLPEDVWSFDAIKKDISRHTDIRKNNDYSNFLKKVDKLISGEMERMEKQNLEFFKIQMKELDLPR